MAEMFTYILEGYEHINHMCMVVIWCIDRHVTQVRLGSFSSIEYTCIWILIHEYTDFIFFIFVTNTNVTVQTHMSFV